MNIRSRKWRYLAPAFLIVLAALGLGRKPVAHLFFERGMRAKAEWQLEQAVRSFDWSTSLQSDFIKARFEKGLCYQLRGDFLASQREFDQLIHAPIQGTELHAKLLNAVGVNRFSFNEPDAAMEAHQQSLDLARRLGNRRLEGHALIDLSRVLYHSKGDADVSLERLQQALQIARETGDELIEADALRNTGVIYWWLKGEVDRPMNEYYLPALQIYRRHHDLRSAAITLTNIGYIYFRKGDYLQFLKYQNEAVEIKSRIGDLAGLSDSYATLGGLYDWLGNYRRASGYYEKSLELSRRLGYRLAQNDIETSLAKLYRDLGEFDKAIALLRDLPERARETPLLAKYYTGELAHCYLLKGELESALAHAEQALRFGALDPTYKVSALIRLGRIYTEMRDWQRASEVLAEAEKVLQKKQKYEGETVQYHLACARLAESQGQRSRAINLLLEAAQIESHVLTANENRLLRGQNRQIYDRLFTLLLDQTGNAHQVAPLAGTARAEDLAAFDLIEQLKYRAFRSFVATLGEQKPDPPHFGSKEEEAFARIKRLSARLKEQESSLLRQQLGQAYNDYQDLVLQSEVAQPQNRLLREARPADLASVQKMLDAGTALVEYLFAEDRVFAIVITSSALRSVLLPVTRQNLSAKVKLFRSMIFNNGSSMTADWQPVAKDLRRVLIDPLEQTGVLSGKHRLGLIPYGFLHDLPFAGMASEGVGRPRFLVEDYSIFFPPSATYLTSEKPLSNQAALTVLSFGRNESEEPKLPPLKFAAEEALAVARILGGEARVGDRASETELKHAGQRFRFIHLATHAVLEPEMPLLSRLKLSRTPEDDGNLNVREILELGLRAELVTLGACRTGQSFSAGDNELGELDRIGPIEAFLHAGARSVLASQLPINDRPTAEFMKAFYRKLGSKSKSDALAETQRAMLRGELTYIESNETRPLTHPRYWSPFILVGDYR